MNVLGIDPSLNSLGYAYVDEDGRPVTGTIKAKDLRGLERLAYIRREVRKLMEVVKPTVVAYEGYSMGKFANRQYDLAELGGVLKLMLYSSNIRLLIVPPTSLKLFSTGKGNADKDTVKVAMAKHRGTFFKSDDEADAYALLRMGEGSLNRRVLPRDRKHHTHRALEGCTKVGW